MVLVLMFYPVLCFSEPAKEKALVALCELDELLRAAYREQSIEPSSVQVSSKEIAQLGMYIEEISPMAELALPAIEPINQKKNYLTREL